jgi:hypothetical protein
MKKIIIATLAIAVLGTSCRKMIEGTSGQMTTEYRQAPAFNKIHLQGNIDVFLSQDTSFSIRVEAGENLIDYIETNVVDGEMIIHEANNNLANTKPIKVYINTDSIENIVLEGSGNFDGDNILADNLNVLLSGSGHININTFATEVNFNVTGSGDAYILGTSNILNLLIQGSGDVNSKFLQTQNANVTINGSGDAIVNVSDTLSAVVNGSGDIDYYGNPTTVSTAVNGSGNIQGH